MLVTNHAQAYADHEASVCVLKNAKYRKPEELQDSFIKLMRLSLSSNLEIDIFVNKFFPDQDDKDYWIPFFDTKSAPALYT